MENTLILIVTHRGLEPETAACLRALKCPSRIEIAGVADICKARSVAFDKALAAMQGTPIDTVLCVDDDMTFQPDQAQRLVTLSRATGHPTGAIAVTRDGVVAARPLPPGLLSPIVPPRPRWLSGLAFTAIPRAELERVAPRLTPIGGVRPWCLTGEHPAFPGDWTREDIWFCAHFGGIELAPIGVGHLKKVPLVPDEETIRRVQAYGSSPS